MIGVVILEKDLMVRTILEGYIAQVEGYQVVGMGDSLAEAQKIYDEGGAQLILGEVTLQDGDVLEWLARLRYENKPVDFIAVTGDPRYCTFYNLTRYGLIGKPCCATAIASSSYHRKLRCCRRTWMRSFLQIWTWAPSGMFRMEYGISADILMNVFTIMPGRIMIRALRPGKWQRPWRFPELRPDGIWRCWKSQVIWRWNCTMARSDVRRIGIVIKG